MKKETNFLGNGKQIGSKVQVSLNYDKLLKLSKFKADNGKRYITIDVIPLRETNQYEQTHTVVEYVPFKKEK
jgi:hypothetical protein